MKMLNIPAILEKYEIFQDINILKCNMFKKKSYKIIIKCNLILLQEKRISIIICIPEKWYLDLIDIYVENYNEIDFLPHIDREGKICLFETEGILIDNDLEGILIQSLFRAKNILDEGLNKTNIEDFIDEFEQYWSQLPECRRSCVVIPSLESSQNVKCKFESVLKSNNKKQREYLNRFYTSTIYVSKDAESLKQWKIENTSIMNAAFFVVSSDDIILPPDIRRSVTVDYLNELLYMLSPKQCYDILKILGNYKVILFAIRQPRGNVNYIGFFVVGGEFHWEHDKVCLKNVLKIQPISVTRVDTPYLMMRTGKMNTDIAEKKILVVGCGSIGGYLIDALVKTGFKTVTIVDNDILHEENIYRHVLGMEYVSKYKCVGLEEYIFKNIPEVSIRTIAEKIEDIVIEKEINLEDYDLVVSTTGNHNVNRWMNLYIHNNKISTPVIYAWNEVCGIGNHIAYFRYGNEGCYECFFGRNEDTGELYDKTAYCESGQKIAFNDGGCGRSYVPYGNSISLKTVILCLDVIRDVFNNNLKHNLIISSKGDDVYLNTMGLNTSGRYSRQEKKVIKRTGNQFVNIECGVCNNGGKR